MTSCQTRSRRVVGMEDDKMVARKLFSVATTAVLPHLRLREIMQFDEALGELSVDGRVYKTTRERGCHVVGFGKAVIGMAAEIQRLLGPAMIRSMTLSVPHGICDNLVAAGHHEQLPQFQDGLILVEGAKNNVPDSDSLRASKMISAVAENLEKDDLLIALISGGGSALLPAPIAPLTLEGKAKITQELMKAGATIQDLNAIRIHLSSLKGGKLAAKAKPAQVIGLILSDIIGDPVELISSGPTVFNHDVSDAFEILDKYGVHADEQVKDILSRKVVALKSQDFFHVDNVLVGNNLVALEACQDYAKIMNFDVHILSSQLSGEASKVGALLGSLAFHVSHSNPSLDEIKAILDKLGVFAETSANILSCIVNTKKPLCLLAGGETTVKVSGTGTGGRNQEMVLAAMLEYHILDSDTSLQKRAKVAFLSAGTDGIDGPTNAAGAIADETMCLVARSQGLDPMSYLKNNDSNTFFCNLSRGENLIMTGHTGTNVMDIQILLITPNV